MTQYDSLIIKKWDLHMIFEAAESPSRNIHNLLAKLDHLISVEKRLFISNRTHVTNYKIFVWMNLVNWRICSVDNHRNVKHFRQNIHKESYGKLSIEFQDRIIDEKVWKAYQTNSFGGENSKEYCWIERVEFISTLTKNVEDFLYCSQFFGDILGLSKENPIVQPRINVVNQCNNINL